MAGSLNLVVLVGNVGKDPELKYTPGGTAITTFSVATSSRRKNNVSGQYEEETEWHNIKALGKTAEVAAEYLKKGSSVNITGSVKTETWNDKNTQEKKYKTVILVDRLNLIGKAERKSAFAEPVPAAGSAPEEQLPITDNDIPF